MVPEQLIRFPVLTVPIEIALIKIASVSNYFIIPSSCTNDFCFELAFFGHHMPCGIIIGQNVHRFLTNIFDLIEIFAKKVTVSRYLPIMFNFLETSVESELSFPLISFFLLSNDF